MKTGLFIPCYVDVLYPAVGDACLRLLRHFGCDVVYPQGQTCCGQPMANAGFEQEARPLAERMERLFQGCGQVVAPSVSCMAFVRLNYSRLLDHECQMATHCCDIIEFIHDRLRPESLPGEFRHRVSVHNSCHGVRELHLSAPTERNIPPHNKIIDLLRLKAGIEVVEPDRPDECCGFGGMFAVEEKAVSAEMGRAKLQRHIDTGADIITGADCSCLLHLSGIASKEGHDGIRFMHAAEILAAGL